MGSEEVSELEESGSSMQISLSMSSKVTARPRGCEQLRYSLISLAHRLERMFLHRDGNCRARCHQR